MAINSVDLERALSSKTYAQQVLRSGIATTEEKAQISAKWGEDFVKQALGQTSEDINDVKIDDVSYDAAKEAGKQTAKDSIGYDGHTSKGAWGDAAMGAASFGVMAFTQLATKKTMESIGKGAKKILGDKLTNSAIGKCGGKATLGKNVGAWVAATLAAAEATRYLSARPNKEQVEATQNILNSELPQAQSALYTAQSDMADATEETTALAEEAEAANEEAGEKIEENKILFDFYREQFLALKQKAESGEQLTVDEKALMKQLSPVMEELGVGIEETGEETSETVNDLYDDIETYQEAYDMSAETIAEVEGLTDLAEGFDETTRTMCYVESVGQGLNAASAGAAVAQLAATNFLGINTPFIVLGTYAAAISGPAVGEQLGYASQVTNEIEFRRETQELGSQTNDLYNEELENFVGNMEVTEDLELEMPEDLEVPEQPVVTDDGSTPADPLAAAAAGADPNANNNGGLGIAAGINQGNGATNSGLGLASGNNGTTRAGNNNNGSTGFGVGLNSSNSNPNRTGNNSTTGIVFNAGNNANGTNNDQTAGTDNDDKKEKDKDKDK